MKSLGNFPDPFIAEIAGQPDAVRRAAAAAIERSDLLAQAAAAARRGRIVLSGMGSSYDACYPASTYLAAEGIAAPMHDAAELLHFRLAALDAGDLLVLVSQSGESAETAGVARALRERPSAAPTIVTVTNGTGNTLARHADLALDTDAGEETGPSTMTFVAALTVMAALARAIADGSGAPLDAAGAGRTADAIARVVRDAELPDRLVGWLGEPRSTVILGRGAARAASEMGALTVKEAVGMPVEALQTAQFRHGPLELARLGSAVWFVTAGGATPAGIPTTDVGALDRLLAPAAAIVPVQLLAWRLSILAGRPPGSYVHATKVTTRE